MTTYNAAAWLLDRHVDAGDGGRIAFRGRRRDDGLRRRCSGRCGGPSTRCEALDVRRGERVALVVDDEPAFPAWFLGAPARRRRAGAAVDDADAARAGGDRRRRRRRRRPCCRRPYAGYRRRARRGRRRAASRRRRSATPAAAASRSRPRLGVVHRRRRARRSPRRRPTRPAFWLYSSGTTGLPKGVMHRHGSLQATAETYAREVLGDRPRRPLPVGRQAVLRLRARQLADVPVRRRRHRDPQPAPADAARASPTSSRAERPTLFFASPGFVAGLLDADVPGDDVRVGAGDGHGRRGAARRPAAPLRRALRAPGARRHRHDRGAAHLPVQPHGRRAARHERHAGARLRGPARRRGRRRGRRRPTRRATSRCGGRRSPPATGAATRRRGPRSGATGCATGDVYTRSADGYWTFLGRNSDMIKAGGIWVSPAEVEAVLVEHPDVLEAAVVGARDAAGLEMTVAFLVARQGRTIDATSIDAHCRERMAAFKRPRAGPRRRRAAEDGDRQDPALRPARPPRRDLVTSTVGRRAASMRSTAPRRHRRPPVRRPPLVFLHEGLGSIELWRDVPRGRARRAGRRARSSTPAPGYGRSVAGARCPGRSRTCTTRPTSCCPRCSPRLGHRRGRCSSATATARRSPCSTPAPAIAVAGLVLLAPHVFVEDVTVAGIAAARDAYATTTCANASAATTTTSTARSAAGTTSGSPGLPRLGHHRPPPGINAPVLAIQGADDVRHRSPARRHRGRRPGTVRPDRARRRRARTPPRGRGCRARGGRRRHRASVTARAAHSGLIESIVMPMVAARVVRSRCRACAAAPPRGCGWCRPRRPGVSRLRASSAPGRAGRAPPTPGW